MLPTIQKYTYTNLFTVLVIAKYWVQSKYPYIGEWWNKPWYIHAAEHYTAVKKNENELYELMESDFQGILLSKKTQNPKDYLYHANLHVRKEGI